MSPATLSLISYCAGGSLFFICTLILVKLHHAKLLPISLVLASFISTVWSFSLAYSALSPLPDTIIVLLEFIRYTGWILGILFTLHFFTGMSLTRNTKLTILFLLIAFFIANTIVLPQFYSHERSAGINYQLSWGGMLLGIAGVVCIEQVYRNISTTIKPAFQYFCLSLGTMFFYDLYMFADALIYKIVDPNLWAARGIINSMAAILIVFAVTRPQSRPTISVSRAMVFYTASLIAAGLFLFIMALGGYYARNFGGSWGRLAQIALLVGGSVVIAALSSSTRIRGKVKVWISKNFFSHKYDYRAEWLKLIKILSEPAKKGNFYETSIIAVAEIFKSPAGCLWLKHDKTFQPSGSFNMPMPENAVEDSNSPFIKHLESDWIFDKRTSPTDDRYKLPAWSEELPNVWLILPLLNENDLIGFILLTRLDSEKVSPLTWEDLDLMKTIGRQIASYLEAHLSTERLTQSKQFDTYNQLTAFIMHDLKNLIAQQQLVVKNAARHKENPAFVDDAIETIENSVQRMSNLLQKMQKKEPSDAKTVPIDKVLKEAVMKCQNITPIPSLRIENSTLRVKADKDHLIMVIAHVIKNAQEATQESGFVDINLQEVDGHAILEVEDNGIGMDKPFINQRLFKPFDTTKTGKGMGIGVYQTREFIRSLGGDVTVTSEPNVGTTFTLKIPVYEKDAN